MVFAECSDYYLGKPVRVDFVACEHCGLVQQSPVPHDVGPLYEEYPVHAARSSLVDGLSWFLMHDVYFDTSHVAPGATILDYGCGNGAYLALHKGKRFDLLGFELDAVHADDLSRRLGVPVFSDVEALIHAHGGRIDVLTMHFVLEHVTDLNATFSHVSQLLKPGGHCAIVVPNFSSWECRLFGKKWHGLDPPRHISFPGPTVIDGLARRHSMRLSGTRSVAFPNGVAGSIPVVVLGTFSYRFFLACLPLGLVLSRLAPSGASAFWLVKNA